MFTPARPPITPGAPVAVPVDPTANDSFRRIGVWVAVILVFLRFSFLHELINYWTGQNPYLILIFRVLGAGLMLFSGGLGRIAHRSAAWWLGLLIWMAIGAPFSFWKSDSLNLTFQFAQVSLIMIPIIVGLAWTLEDCRRLVNAIVAGAFVNVLSGNLFTSQEASTRLFNFGSIANPNDYAAHMLYILPLMVLFMVVNKSMLVKMACLVGLVLGLYSIATTASRGALVAIGVVILYCMVRSSTKVRLGTVALIPILVGIAMLLPKSAIDRYGTLFNSSSRSADAPQSEAEASSESRKYLLMTSLDMTLSNPLFGVGVGQFTEVENEEAKRRGKRGAWLVQHNSYTQVSSETGVLGFIFYFGAIVSSFRLLTSIQKRCSKIPHARRYELTAYFLTISMVGFCTAIFFLSLAYTVYLPCMTAIAIVLDRAVRREIELPLLRTRPAGAF